MSNEQAPFKIDLGPWAQLSAPAAKIRTEVFVGEQGVAPELELDALDAVCLHAVAFDQDGAAIGTGRLLPNDHIGRMAVSAAARGSGVGSALLLALIDAARARGAPELVLAAQLHALDFYARHGFEPYDEVFLDAGIEHRWMRLVLGAAPSH